jgi:hypothetical protein
MAGTDRPKHVGARDGLRAHQPRWPEMLTVVAEAFVRMSWRKRGQLLALAAQMFWLRLRIEALLLEMRVTGSDR